MSNFFLDPNDALKAGALQGVPCNVSHLSKQPDFPLPLSEINIYWNQKNQHAFIDGFTNQKYYDDYLMTTTFSESMQRLQSSQVKRLIELVTRSIGECKSFVEIGCGDGSFLSHASQCISYVLGIEPSKRFCDQASSKGLSVVNTFLNRKTCLQIDQKFDAFASRQVFEHLDDPLEVLLSIKSLLNPGAVGLIEVPNGYRALQNNLFYEIFPDHVSYYSVNSLVELASSAGFNVISCNESFNGHYLELWIRYNDDITNQIQTLDFAKNQICNAISEFCELSANDGLNVYIWGCGAKTMSIIPGLSKSCLSRIKCIVDSDPNKVGLYMPNTSIPIVDFDFILNEGFGKILILALSYVDEIMSIVVASSLKDCPMYTLSNQGIVKPVRHGGLS